MKKVLKNILKWLVCVFLTFSAVFTVLQFSEKTDALEYIMARNGDMKNAEKLLEMKLAIQEEDIMELEKSAEYSFNTEDTNAKLKELYNKYPIGTIGIYMYCYGLDMELVGFIELAKISIILGLIVGTAIYLLIDKDKKELKTVIITYILLIVISGFVYEYVDSILSVSNMGLDFSWNIPADEYMLLATIAFAIVIAVRHIKYKNIADKLNEKLKTKKEEKAEK